VADGGADAPKDAASFDEVAARAALLAFETKVCEAYKRCDPIDFARQFGTVDACSQIEFPIANTAGNYGYFTEAGALANQFAHGTTLTPDSLSACTAALDFSSCSTLARFFNEAVMPDPCRGIVYGTLPNGASCGTWNQCASGRCLSPPNVAFNACGTCVPQAALGASCLYACPAGAICAPQFFGSTTSVCKPLGDVGDSCDSDTFCHFDLVCASGRCKVPPPDGACDPAVPALPAGFFPAWLRQAGCPVFPGMHYCDEATAKCTAMPLANVGESCGEVTGPPYFIGCVAGLACTAVAGDTGDASAPRTVCAPLIQPGDACYPADFIYEVQKCATGVCYQQRCQQNGPAECSAPDVPP
jgi:hypothetical protein